MRKLFVLLLSTFCISWAFASPSTAKEEPIIKPQKTEKNKHQKTVACCATTTETVTHKETICEGGGKVTFTAEAQGTGCDPDGDCALAYKRAASQARINAMIRIMAGITELRADCP